MKELAFACCRADFVEHAYLSVQPLLYVFIGRTQTNALFTLTVATAAGQ
jgi:hypothetical protein